MQSNPDGGYIVIGADNKGKVVAGLTAELARHFDEATLRPSWRSTSPRPSFRERKEISCRRAASEGVRAIARVLGARRRR